MPLCFKMAQTHTFTQWHIMILLVECCCCCCWVTSVVSDSVQPHRQQPTRLPCPWDSPGKNTGVGCHVLLQCMKVKSEREVAQLCPTLSDPMDCSLPRLLHPWNSPGKSTGVGCHCLLWRIKWSKVCQLLCRLLGSQRRKSTQICNIIEANSSSCLVDEWALPRSSITIHVYQVLAECQSLC